MDCNVDRESSRAVLLKPQIVDVLLFNIRNQIIAKYDKLTIVVDENGSSFLAVEGKRTNNVVGLRLVRMHCPNVLVLFGNLCAA